MHDRLSCTHDQGLAHTCAHARVPGKACLDKPPWMLCRDKDFSVATGFGCSVSRHSLGVETGPGLWAVS